MLKRSSAEKGYNPKLGDYLSELRESNDFWQEARNNLLLPLVKNGPVLDVGCGAGIITKSLIDKGLDVYSIDIDRKSCKNTKRINPKTFCCDISRLNSRLNKGDFQDFYFQGFHLPRFNSIILADVLAYIEDDVDALFKCSSLLSDSGQLIISVPYHNFFWTKTDVVLHKHFRRYSKKELAEKLKTAGFRVRYTRFWNFLAVLPALSAKILKKSLPHRRISKSKFNALLKWYFLKIENRIRVPLGLTLICVAEKESAQIA